MLGSRGPLRAAVLAAALVFPTASLFAQVPFEEVVSNLKNPDPQVRLSALRLLREVGYIDAAVPVGALVADADERVQLDAIQTELNLFVPERLATRRKIAGVVEVRSPSVGRAAFLAGPGVTVATAVPVEVMDALIKAMRDGRPQIRYEAIYTVGVLLPTGVSKGGEATLKAALDALVYGLKDEAPRLRAAAADVIGRVFGQCDECALAGKEALAAVRTSVGDNLISGINDKDKDARVAAVQALGGVRYEQAVHALTEQFNYYEKGELARAALDALAHIAHPASLPLFEQHLRDGDADVRRAAVEGFARTAAPAQARTLEERIGPERSDEVALAYNYAFERFGRGSQLNQILNALRDPELHDQARGYLLEFGARNVPALISYLQESDSRLLVGVADVLGRMRATGSIPALEALLKSPDKTVVGAAQIALARIGRPAPSPATKS